MNDSAVAAIEYALNNDEPEAFLRCWFEGNFDAIRREWENVPEEVFIGADPFHPGTKKILDAPSKPNGWLRAVDEALVVTHLGVANEGDTYEQAREKLNNLIGWHTDVATDPAVNGGYKLVPIESTPAMITAALEASDMLNVHRVMACYDAMLAAATEVKP